MLSAKNKPFARDMISLRKGAVTSSPVTLYDENTEASDFVIQNEFTL